MASRKRCQRWLKSGTRRRLLRLLDGWNGLSRVFRVGALEDDDGDPPTRSLAVLVEAGHLPGVLPIEALVVLLAVDDPRSGLERLAEGLDLDDRVGAEVVVPRRVGGCAALGCDDDVITVVAGEGERVLANLSSLGSGGGQDQDVAALEGAARRAALVGSQVVDQGLVEVIATIAHASLLPRNARGYSEADLARQTLDVPN